MISDAYRGKLQALLQAHAEHAAKMPAADKTPPDQPDRQMCGARLRSVVRPILDAVMAELKNAGHEASVREHIERDDAYPSVSLSFTPRSGLSSAAMLRYATPTGNRPPT